jgi:hypothetical protein
MIEPRNHPAIEFVLNNFLENLSHEWQIIWFHGNQNIELSNQVMKNMSKHGDRLQKIQLDVENLNAQTYSLLLTTASFYDNIPTETFLIFQTDSIIFKNNKDKINDFMEYDYVGAPWQNRKVGNGGLSLRKKSKMLEIIKIFGPSEQNEDVYFSLQHNIYLKKPTFEKSKKFSVESVYFKQPFGVHNPWRYIRDKIHFLIDEDESLSILMSLQDPPVVIPETSIKKEPIQTNLDMTIPFHSVPKINISFNPNIAVNQKSVIINSQEKMNYNKHFNKYNKNFFINSKNMSKPNQPSKMT